MKLNIASVSFSISSGRNQRDVLEAGHSCVLMSEVRASFVPKSKWRQQERSFPGCTSLRTAGPLLPLRRRPSRRAWEARGTTEGNDAKEASLVCSVTAVRSIPGCVRALSSSGHFLTARVEASRQAEALGRRDASV